MNYKDQKNIAGETENLSSDEQNVARLLSDLKRVDAPKDFDFHLKARIANASPGDYKPVRLFPVLRYAMPLALFLLLGAAFVLTNSHNGSNVPVVVDLPNTAVPSPAADSNQVQQTEVDSAFVNLPGNVQEVGISQTGKQEFVVRQTKDSKLPREKKPAGNFNGGGSYDSTGNESRAPILAPVLRANNSNSVRDPGRPGPKIPLQVRQMLMLLGIDASDAGQKIWTVRSLTKDGIAERSGLRVGDQMEAIDDQPINTLYVDSFSVKSISVRRNDKVIKIDIQTNKP